MWIFSMEWYARVNCPPSFVSTVNPFQTMSFDAKFIFPLTLGGIYGNSDSSVMDMPGEWEHLKCIDFSVLLLCSGCLSVLGYFKSRLRRRKFHLPKLSSLNLRLEIRLLMAGLLRKVLTFHALDHETKVSIFLRFIISVFVVCVSGDYFSPESLGRPMARNLNVASDGRKHIGCRSVYYTLVFMKIYFAHIVLSILAVGWRKFGTKHCWNRLT